MFGPSKPKPNKTEVIRSQASIRSAPTTYQPMPSHEQISLRAYEIYQSGGYADGRDQQDWLQAEREMFSTRK